MKKIKHTHRSSGKPYKLSRKYNHNMAGRAKGVPAHATHSSGSKRHK